MNRSQPMPDRPAVIQATFADWRTVKGRRVLQLVFEVPLEQQTDVLMTLGAPVPDNPAWCAVARLQQEKAEPPKPKDESRSERAREAYALKDEMQKAATRAGMLAKDRRFQEWCHELSEDRAAKYIRRWCGISSRAVISGSEVAYQSFLALESTFKQATGQLPEIRG